MPYRPPRYGGYVGGYSQASRGGALSAIGAGMQSFANIWMSRLEQERAEKERLAAEKKAQLEAEAAALAAPQSQAMTGALDRASEVTDLAGYQTELARTAREFPSGTAISPGGFAATMPTLPGQETSEPVGKALATKLPGIREKEKDDEAIERLKAALGAYNAGKTDIKDLAEFFRVPEYDLREDITEQGQTAAVAKAEKDKAVADAAKAGAQATQAEITTEGYGEALDVTRETGAVALEKAQFDLRALKNPELESGLSDKEMLSQWNTAADDALAIYKEIDRSENKELAFRAAMERYDVPDAVITEVGRWWWQSDAEHLDKPKFLKAMTEALYEDALSTVGVDGSEAALAPDRVKTLAPGVIEKAIVEGVESLSPRERAVLEGVPGSVYEDAVKWYEAGNSGPYTRGW